MNSFLRLSQTISAHFFQPALYAWALACASLGLSAQLLAAPGVLPEITPAYAPAVTPETTSHQDVLIDAPHLRLSAVLEQVVALHPQQALLNAHQQLVQARRTLATSLLPQAPSVGFSHQSDALMSRRDEREWQAQLQLPIWLPGQRQARDQVANLAEENLGQDRASIQLLAAGLLREAVWEVALRRNDVTVFDARLDTLRQLRTDVNKRFRAGEVAKLELMQADQQLLQAERDALNAQAELMHAQYRYQQLTGMQALPSHLNEPLSSRKTYTESAVWQAALAKVKLAEGQRDLTMIEQRQNPTLTLNTRTIQGGFDQQFNSSMGVAITLPLQSEVSRAPQLANAELIIGDARSQLATLRRSLENALHEAEHNLEVSRQALEILTRQQRIASDNAQLARRAYLLGELDFSQRLRLEQTAFEAERNLHQQQLIVQLNIAKYNQAVGVLP